jgi:hypothetical protein
VEVLAVEEEVAAVDQAILEGWELFLWGEVLYLVYVGV